MRILAILDRPETALFTLRAAGDMARRLNAREIRLLHPRPMTDPAFQAPDEGMPTPARRKAFARQVAGRAKQLHDIARDWSDAAGDPLAARAGWVETAGDIRRIVTHEAREAGLVVVSRPRADDRDDVGQALAGALYDAGAPVLVAPLQAYDTVGLRPIVAWAPSPALDRALDLARPLLESAGHVTFVIGSEHETEDASPEWARMLAARGVPVTIDRFTAPRERMGEEIRAHALTAGGDLLIMGAYTHSRFVEWLFGGPTRDLFAHATLPILTCHHGFEDSIA
ncbi:universal stress protein [Gluconacetobacter takamatsuzukensis]|uniref:Universal stress protein n=1 Tax=Gluconacetobacter takamatsuzukensis TaxID=1286190 RepID=A0A7W4PQI6_9PROT|nr:universal stress protein [Gluconacetobacter takamatsuzukensis]MBB2206605.1 universal stress protein [Gluconacetobacter takamatsuzukensis]